MFPPNVKFKVALHKLTCVNSINNIGKGANTRFWVSRKNVQPTEAYLPDISIDTIDEFATFLVGQLLAAAPEYFPKIQHKRAISIHQKRIEIQKRRKRNTKPLHQTVSEELPQNDAPIADHDDDYDVLSSEGSVVDEPYNAKQEANLFKTRMETDMNQLQNIRDEIFKICFSREYGTGFANRNLYLLFASRFQQYYFDFLKFQTKAYENERIWNEFSVDGHLPEWPHEALMDQMNWINDIADEYILPTIKIPLFPETQEHISRYQELEKAVNEGKSYLFDAYPELKKQFSIKSKIVNSTPDEFQIFMHYPLKVIHDLKDMLSDNDIRSENKILLSNIADEYRKLLLNRYHLIDTMLDTLSGLLHKTWEVANTPPDTISAIVDDYTKLVNWKWNFVSHLSALIEHYAHIENDKTVSTQLHLFRPPELTVLNPITNAPFKTLSDYRMFRTKMWNEGTSYRGLSPDELANAVNKKAVTAYIKKRQQGIITDSTPDSELTGDELFLRNFDKRPKPPPPPPPPPPPTIDPAGTVRRSLPGKSENETPGTATALPLTTPETPKQHSPPKRRPEPITKPLTPSKQMKSDESSKNTIVPTTDKQHDESKNTIEEKEIETDTIKKPEQPASSLEKEEKEDETENVPITSPSLEWETTKYQYTMPHELILYLPYFLTHDAKFVRIFDIKAVNFHPHFLHHGTFSGMTNLLNDSQQNTISINFIQKLTVLSMISVFSSN
jgi:hypothetical protein